MIIAENQTINGREFILTYSDNNKFIERDGVEYAEALDPAELGRTYTETDEDIPEMGEPELPDPENN